MDGFDTYYKEVESALHKEFGLSVNEIGRETVETGYEVGMSVPDLMDHVQDKYNLNRIAEWNYDVTPPSA